MGSPRDVSWKFSLAMKILNVNMSLDPVSGGGTAERTFQISRALMREGAECTILTTDVGLNLNRRKALKGVEVVALPCLVKRFYLPAVSFRQLNRLVSECDVIEIMNHWTIINALVYLIAKKLNKPYIVCPAGALPLYGRSRWLKTVYNWVIGKNIIREAEGHVAISIAEIPQFQQYGLSY